MKPVRLLRGAFDDARAAARYYRAVSHPLGNDCLDAIADALHEIATHPEAWPAVDDTIRRRQLRRFPYYVIYRIDADEIVVLAIAHQRRRPGYWQDRQ